MTKGKKMTSEIPFLNEYKMDEDKEENGAEVDMGHGVVFRIGRFNSKRSQKVYRELERPHRTRRNRNQNLPDDVAEEILIKHMARAIVLGWRGMVDANGKEIPYSVEKAEELLRNYKELRDDVSDLAMQRDLFKEEEEEEDRKNS